MPVELQVIRASEFVRLDAAEELDFEASKKALQALAHACQKRGLDRAVLDLRSLPIPEKPAFTPTQLAALIDTFRAAGFGQHQRLAVLYRNDPHGGVRTFAFIGRIQGWQVRAFDDFEHALHWLSEDHLSRPGSCEKETPIPINKRSPERRGVPVAPPPGRAPRSSRRKPFQRR